MLSTKIGRIEFANAPGMSAILTPLIDHAMVQEYENTTPSRHHVPLAMTQMTTSSLAASISLWDSTQTGGPLSHDSHTCKRTELVARPPRRVRHVTSPTSNPPPAQGSTYRIPARVPELQAAAPSHRTETGRPLSQHSHANELI